MSIPYLSPPNTRYYKLHFPFVLYSDSNPYAIPICIIPSLGSYYSLPEEHLRISLPLASLVHLLSAAPAQANYDIT